MYYPYLKIKYFAISTTLDNAKLHEIGNASILPAIVTNPCILILASNMVPLCVNPAPIKCTLSLGIWPM